MTYHVTGRLTDVFKEKCLVSRVYTGEHYKGIDMSAEKAIQLYQDFLKQAENTRNLKNQPIDMLADQIFGQDEEYKRLRRCTHIHFSNNPLYILWKFHKRRKYNEKSGRSLSDVAIIKLKLDESEIRQDKFKHIKVFNKIPDLHEKIIDFTKSYPGFLKMTLRIYDHYLL